MDGSNLSVLHQTAVGKRYSAAAQQVEPALCCPVRYDPKLLQVLPDEILERDYGCGDPSRYVTTGETVLDLGCGGGKICYLASQLVGAEGRVIGVDLNDDMLALARKYQDEIGQRIGWQNVTFLKGRIQDLALDLQALEQRLTKHPVTDPAGLLHVEQWCAEQRRTAPLIADQSVDVVLSNCVLNLVTPAARQQLFAEVFRVLRPGGRAVISDIVSDVPVPAAMQLDPLLWSGCISGAFVEGAFLQAFADAGFYGIELIERPVTPWQVIDGIEFRSATVRAFKPPVADDNLSVNTIQVMYKGPWQSITDETGLCFQRGRDVNLDAVAASRLAISALRSQFVWKTSNSQLLPRIVDCNAANNASQGCC